MYFILLLRIYNSNISLTIEFIIISLFFILCLKYHTFYFYINIKTSNSEIEF